MTTHGAAAPTVAPVEDPALRWLIGEFPAWEIGLARTVASDGTERTLWIASREGHHPQSALSAAKLHTRLADYVDRGSRRDAARN